MLLRLFIICFLLGGFALAFAEVATQTKAFSPSSPCPDGGNGCMSTQP